MLALLFPVRRRRGVRPVREMLSAEALESRRLLAYTFTLADKTGVTGTAPTDYSVYALGFASYNFSTASNDKAYAQNAFVLGNVDGTPSATPHTFTNLSDSANPAQGGTSKPILPVKLDASNLTFTLPNTNTIPAEGTVPAGASNLPSGRIYVFMVPNGTPLPSISTQAQVTVKDGPTVGLGFTGFTPGSTNTFAYEALEFTINTPPNLSTTTAGSLDIDWTSVDQFQFPLTMQADISVARYAETRSGAVTQPFSETYHVGAGNDDGTSYTRNDVFTHYAAFTATEPAWKSLVFPASGQPAGILSPLSVSQPIHNPLAGYFDAVLDALYVNGPPPGQTLYLQGNETSVLWETAPAVLTGGVHALALWNSSRYSGSSASNPVWWIKDPRALAGDTHGSTEYQIFGGTGAFSAAHAVQNRAFAGEGLGTVLDMLNAAINRGIATADANSGLYGTANEKNSSGFNNPVAASLIYWETQAKFYPANVPQNLYAAFLHTAMINNVPVNHPNPTAPQNSAAGTPMGLAYGFSQDEAPGNNLDGDGDLASAFVNPQFGANGSPSTTLLAGQIPAVNDDTPITLTLGPWGTLSKVTVNAPLTFTVVENSQNNPFQWPAAPVPFVDTAATALTVTLSVSGGTIAVNQQAASKIGLTVGGTASMPTIDGPITALNTFFQTKGNVIYTPIPGSLATQTLTTSAVDALNNKAFATSTIDIVSTAAPVVTAPAVFTVNESTATSLIWPTSPVPFADASSSRLTVTLTVTGGSVAFNRSAATAAGLTVGGSPAAPSIAGPIATLNAYFQTAGNVTYTPITGSLVGQTLTTSAFDGSERGQATSAIKIIAPTPGTPTVTLTPGVFTTAVNTPVGLLFTGTPFADTGATPTTVFTVTMSTGGPANGTLAAATGSGVTVVTSAAGATFTGTLSALNTYFTTAPAKITFSPPANVQGTRMLSTVIAVDGKASQPAITTILIGTNVAPTVAAPIAFWVPEQGRMNLVWPRGLQPFSDRDSRLLTVTLSTDSPASVGSFAASRADRTVTVVTTGDVVQLIGRPADLNRYFATVGRITYTAIGPSPQPRVLTVRASDGGAVGVAESAILVRARGPMGVPVINRSATLGSTPAGTPLVITYAQLVAATGATTANSRSVEFLLGGVSSGRLELWDGAKWIRVPAVLPKFKEPILAPGGQIRWTPPARVTGQRPAFRAIAWDGWKMSAMQSQVSVDVT